MDLSQPRFSANELGKFVFSTGAEKRRILRNQKFPKPIQAAYYQRASTAILRSLKGGSFSEAVLRGALHDIQTAPAETQHKMRVLRSNAKAVRRFLTISEHAAPATGEHLIIRRSAEFEFEGVRISVRPDILTTNPGSNFFTYAKLRISSDRYSPDASEVVLLLIQKFAEHQSFEGLGFDASRARLIDCLGQQVFEGHDVSPFKGQQLMKALTEIRALWPFVTDK